MDGNNLFKEDKLEEAMQQYEMAIAYMGDDFNYVSACMGSTMIWLWQSRTHATYINMAACLIT
ncbi:unnamed protein product, partial [Brassica rapa subsp. trilocularis]